MANKMIEVKKDMKTVLLSTFELPYKKIGSWTNMYNYYLSLNEHEVDYIVCPSVQEMYENVKYTFVKPPKYIKYLRFIKHYKYLRYWKAIKGKLELDENLIVKIIDNTGLLSAIDFLSRKEKLRHKIKIVFFFHGYSYYTSSDHMDSFYAKIDHLVLITKKSYEFQVNNVHTIPCEVSQIYNGIDSEVFCPVDTRKKEALRKELNFKEDTLYFIWLSQDRPKKGLHIILKAWAKLIQKYHNIELIVIGTHNHIKAEKVQCLGRIDNNKLPAYYQAANFYLFSTLCHEGFGLSLVEAMKCGCYCIASDIDPISEVLNQEEYGALVQYPNFVDSWIDSISKHIKIYEENFQINPYMKNIPKNIYDITLWCKNINELILRLKT